MYGDPPLRYVQVHEVASFTSFENKMHNVFGVFTFDPQKLAAQLNRMVYFTPSIKGEENPVEQT